VDLAPSPCRHARRTLDSVPAAFDRSPRRAGRGEARTRAVVPGGDRGSPSRGGRSPDQSPAPHRRESFWRVFGRRRIARERGGKGPAMKRFKATVVAVALVLAACGLAEEGTTTTTSAEVDTPTTAGATPPETTDTSTGDTASTEPEA